MWPAPPVGLRKCRCEALKVLVTGAAGFLGAAVIRKLLQYPSIDALVAFDNFSRQNFSLLLDRVCADSEQLTVVMGDILDTNSLRRAMSGCEVVIHLAGVTPNPSNSMDAHVFDQINNWGLANVVRVANEILPRQFLYSSSVSVFGTSDQAIRSTDQPAPKDAYGVSKFDGERQLLALDARVTSEVVRLGNLYGLSEQARFDPLVNRMVLEAKYQGTILIQGAGDQARPILPFETAANFFAEKVVNPQGSRSVTTLISESPSVADIAEIIVTSAPRTQLRFVNRAARLPSLRMVEEENLTETECKLTRTVPEMLANLA